MYFGKGLVSKRTYKAVRRRSFSRLPSPVSLLPSPFSLLPSPSELFPVSP
eukprot:SAG31_NODE_16762_length_697_cov_1.085284_1_plen_49_part_10